MATPKHKIFFGVNKGVAKDGTVAKPPGAKDCATADTLLTTADSLLTVDCDRSLSELLKIFDQNGITCDTLLVKCDSENVKIY